MDLPGVLQSVQCLQCIHDLLTAIFIADTLPSPIRQCTAGGSTTCGRSSWPVLGNMHSNLYIKHAAEVESWLSVQSTCKCLHNIFNAYCIYSLAAYLSFFFMHWIYCMNMHIWKSCSSANSSRLLCDGILSNGENSQTVKLIGKGFLNLVDSLFWSFSFCSSKQATAVRELNGIT